MLRRRPIVPIAVALAALFFGSATPARADALVGVLNPAFGLPLTLGVAALEAVILARVIGGPRPWRESYVANLMSAAVGWVFAVWVGFDQPHLLPSWERLSDGWQAITILAMLFGITLAIEFSYLFWRWRKLGIRQVVLGVLMANVASYAIVIPITYITLQFDMFPL